MHNTHRGIEEHPLFYHKTVSRVHQVIIAMNTTLIRCLKLHEQVHTICNTFTFKNSKSYKIS